MANITIKIHGLQPTQTTLTHWSIIIEEYNTLFDVREKLEELGVTFPFYFVAGPAKKLRVSSERSVTCRFFRHPDGSCAMLIESDNDEGVVADQFPDDFVKFQRAQAAQRKAFVDARWNTDLNAMHVEAIEDLGGTTGAIVDAASAPTTPAHAQFFATLTEAQRASLVAGFGWLPVFKITAQGLQELVAHGIEQDPPLRLCIARGDEKAKSENHYSFSAWECSEIRRGYVGVDAQIGFLGKVFSLDVSVNYAQKQSTESQTTKTECYLVSTFQLQKAKVFVEKQDLICTTAKFNADLKQIVDSVPSAEARKSMPKSDADVALEGAAARLRLLYDRYGYWVAPTFYLGGRIYVESRTSDVVQKDAEKAATEFGAAVEAKYKGASGSLGVTKQNQSATASRGQKYLSSGTISSIGGLPKYNHDRVEFESSLDVATWGRIEFEMEPITNFIRDKTLREGVEALHKAIESLSPTLPMILYRIKSAHRGTLMTAPAGADKDSEIVCGGGAAPLLFQKLGLDSKCQFQVAHPDANLFLSYQTASPSPVKLFDSAKDAEYELMPVAGHKDVVRIRNLRHDQFLWLADDGRPHITSAGHDIGEASYWVLEKVIRPLALYERFRIRSYGNKTTSYLRSARVQNRAAILSDGDANSALVFERVGDDKESYFRITGDTERLYLSYEDKSGLAELYNSVREASFRMEKVLYEPDTYTMTNLRWAQNFWLPAKENRPRVTGAGSSSESSSRWVFERVR
jgi:hypothetical protein